MTTSTTGDAREDLIAGLRRQLDVSQAEASLHLAEVQRYAFIVSELTQAAEGGIFVRQNLASDYMYISDGLSEILGYAPGQIASSYTAFLKGIHPEDLERATREAELSREAEEATHGDISPSPAGLDRPIPLEIDAMNVVDLPAPDDLAVNIFRAGAKHHTEFRYRSAEGKYRWFRTSAKHYVPENGQEQVIGLVIDIHDRKLLEEQRRLVNEELKAFMYSVAHDLRAPVRHIASFAEAIREEPDAPAEERAEYLNYVEHSADKLSRMIDGLLQLSKNQRSRPRITPVDMELLFDRLIRATRQTERQAAELIIERDTVPVIHTDAGLIEQVIENLLSNAVKYSSNRKRAVVKINYYLGEAEHVLSFADNGIGFDTAYADKLFKLFSRLYHADDIPGTGVGLASVHRIMRSLQGSVEADGKPGQGATFTLRIPVKVGATSKF